MEPLPVRYRLVTRIADAGAPDGRISNLAYLLTYFVALIIMADFHLRDGHRREATAVVLVVLVDLLIVTGRTVRARRDYPDLTRYLNTTTQILESMYGRSSFPGLGGFIFTYAIAGLVVPLLIGGPTAGKWWLRGGLWAVAAAFTYFVVNASYTIALILILLGLAWFLVGRLPSAWRGPAVLGLAGIALLANTVLADVVRAVSRMPQLPPTVGLRLEEVAELIVGAGADGGATARRWDVYEQPLDLLLTNPFLGIAGESPLTGAGNHSSWLDPGALFGLMMLFPVVSA